MLNTLCGCGSHKIQPRQKSDSFLRVQFSSNGGMELARNFLQKQILFDRRVTAVVSEKLITPSPHLFAL